VSAGPGALEAFCSRSFVRMGDPAAVAIAAFPRYRSSE